MTVKDKFSTLIESTLICFHHASSAEFSALVLTHLQEIVSLVSNQEGILFYSPLLLSFVSYLGSQSEAFERLFGQEIFMKEFCDFLMHNLNSHVIQIISMLVNKLPPASSVLQGLLSNIITLIMLKDKESSASLFASKLLVYTCKALVMRSDILIDSSILLTLEVDFKCHKTWQRLFQHAVIDSLKGTHLLFNFHDISDLAITASILLEDDHRFVPNPTCNIVPVWRQKFWTTSLPLVRNCKHDFSILILVCSMIKELPTSLLRSEVSETYDVDTIVLWITESLVLSTKKTMEQFKRKRKSNVSNSNGLVDFASMTSLESCLLRLSITCLLKVVDISLSSLSGHSAQVRIYYIYICVFLI